MTKILEVHLSPEAEETYNYLKKQAKIAKIERTILNALHKKSELIKTFPDYGDKIPQKLIPQKYKIKYGITNLFRVELPNFWRMLYTIKGHNIEIIAFVLDILNHKDYNKKFGYKKK
ncbi:MAG: hypothetical protein V1914_01455 [archaeon]